MFNAKEMIIAGILLLFTASFASICYSMVKGNKPYATKEEIVKNYVEFEQIAPEELGGLSTDPSVNDLEYVVANIQYSEPYLFPIPREEVDQIFHEVLEEQIGTPLKLSISTREKSVPFKEKIQNPEKYKIDHVRLWLSISFTDGKELEPEVNGKLAAINMTKKQRTAVKTVTIKDTYVDRDNRYETFIVSISDDPTAFKKTFKKRLESYVCGNISVFLQRQKTGQWGC